MKCIDLGSNREVCWDMALVDTNNNISLDMHKPIRKNIAFACDAPWEGEHCGYGSLVKVGDEYRFYYRAASAGGSRTAQTSTDEAYICLAVSKDGKTFTKPNLGLYEYNGSKDNNIVFSDDRKIDNFSVYLDPNPNCPPDEKYKALSAYDIPGVKRTLAYYKSADGYSFEFVKILPVDGAFDTLNHVLWDDKAKKYRIYIRDFHKPGCKERIEIFGNWELFYSCYRDIRMSESEDFINWSTPRILEFQDGAEDLQLYTNGVTKYHRANVFYGFPIRYINRINEIASFTYLPSSEKRKADIAKKDRHGTALTDAVLMTSRNGLNFIRNDDAFLSPGPENGENWIYGDCYLARGMFETASDFRGEANELSVYAGKGYRNRDVDFVRYTLRLDGLYSWHASFDGGELMTHPLTFSGNKLNVNFETSALGHLRVVICDEQGNPIEGFDSGNIFGNSVSRPVDFEKDLSVLEGKNVRLKIYMKDCDLYSFVFE